MSNPVLEGSDGPVRSADTDSVGRRFEWLRLLGRGGFGEVYLARMHTLNGLEQHVAVKLLPAGLARDSPSVSRLRNEARLLASLAHPVVVAPHDLAQFGARIAMVTEFIEGEDLVGCIDRTGPDPLPVSTQLEIVEQVSFALEVAWTQLRVVHRDVKPQNIRIGRHGNVKLLDFGLAFSEMRDEVAQTDSVKLAGTMRYLAPERFDPSQQTTPASDVYALGCVLYEGIVGVPLVGGAPRSNVGQLAPADDWTSYVRERLALVSDSAVRGLLEAMLAYDPNRRPTTREVRERCEAMNAADPRRVRLATWCRDRRWPEHDVRSMSPGGIASPLPSVPNAELDGPVHRVLLAGHLPPDRLASSHPSPEEAAHLAACVACRAARRLVLRESWVGHYRVLGRIGRGGMAEVYAAIREDTGARCALKVMRLGRPELVRRILREAEVQQGVVHPNVLPLLEVFEHRSAPVLVLPLVEGPTLAEFSTFHRLPPDVAAAWFTSIVDGVAALHRAGLVHRDLKPANVLLDPSSGVVVPRVADFGLAKWLSHDETSSLTKSGTTLGTPAYTAPEQMFSPRAADPRADVWSLGIVALELFTGVRVRTPEHDLPEPWNDVIGRLLQRDPDARPNDASEVKALLPPALPVGEEWADRCRSLAPQIEPHGIDWPGWATDSPVDPTGSDVPPGESARSLPGKTSRLARRSFWLVVAGAAMVLAILALRPVGTDQRVASASDVEPVADAPLIAPVTDAPPAVPAPVATPVVARTHTPSPAATSAAAGSASSDDAGQVPVWVKTRPWGYVTIGSQRWATEDQAIRLAPGRHVLNVESYDRRYQAELPIEVASTGENTVCWDFERKVSCSR